MANAYIMHNIYYIIFQPGLNKYSLSDLSSAHTFLKTTIGTLVCALFQIFMIL